LAFRIVVPLLALGVALAGSQAALAHTKTFKTSLTLTTTKHHVDAGSDVKLQGSLSSGKDRCKSAQTVEIWRDGAAVGTATTSKSGRYTFTDAAPATGTHEYQAKFAGSTFGTPPKHQHTCAASESKAVKVTVEA
jgi:hypothetical protein